MLERKLEQRFPSHQNAVDLFEGLWASKIEEVFPGLESGPGPFFRQDTRPLVAAQHLGIVPGSLHGMSIVELGPLEGAQTYQLANLGADRIVAVEASTDAFLKCLIVKEILQIPRCQFLLGDCLTFLQESRERFDMVYCAGILYHMENPFELIKAISARTERVFLWTHYYAPGGCPAGVVHVPKAVLCDGVEMTFYEHTYPDSGSGPFWGGNRPSASWLSREDIERCFRHFGYALTVHADQPTLHGPCITATAIREQRGNATLPTAGSSTS